MDDNGTSRDIQSPVKKKQKTNSSARTRQQLSPDEELQAAASRAKRKEFASSKSRSRTVGPPDRDDGLVFNTKDPSRSYFKAWCKTARMMRLKKEWMFASIELSRKFPCSFTTRGKIRVGSDLQDYTRYEIGINDDCFINMREVPKKNDEGFDAAKTNSKGDDRVRKLRTRIQTRIKGNVASGEATKPLTSADKLRLKFQHAINVAETLGSAVSASTLGPNRMRTSKFDRAKVESERRAAKTTLDKKEEAER